MCQSDAGWLTDEKEAMSQLPRPSLDVGVELGRDLRHRWYLSALETNDPED